MKILFDLDGTITSQETLPLIAKTFGVEKEIAKLTHDTMYGNVPFIESFIRRVNILSSIPVSEISDLLETVPMYSQLFEFIREHPVNCIVVTGNLTCWCDKLMKKLGCEFYGSTALVENNRLVKLKKILRKESVVDEWKSRGELVTFVGDGNNDIEAMRHADYSIATGLTHAPAQGLLSICDYLIFNENALCRQLNQLL